MHLSALAFANFQTQSNKRMGSPCPSDCVYRPDTIEARRIYIAEVRLLLSVFLLFTTENAEAEVNTVFVDLTTAEATSIGNLGPTCKAAESAQTDDFDPQIDRYCERAAVPASHLAPATHRITSLIPVQYGFVHPPLSVSHLIPCSLSHRVASLHTSLLSYRPIRPRIFPVLLLTSPCPTRRPPPSPSRTPFSSNPPSLLPAALTIVCVYPAALPIPVPVPLLPCPP
ncbi:hypothetical protein C8R44DRAFT_888027 [Mycena epipterygia]|nr:hypothetical protein C8R44DRAFT_888027 [Mycena epipterygia]